MIVNAIYYKNMPKGVTKKNLEKLIIYLESNKKNDVKPDKDKVENAGTKSQTGK